MLSWVGKRPLWEVCAFPARPVERFRATAGVEAAGSVDRGVDWSDRRDRYEHGGNLFHGDDEEMLAHLMATGFRARWTSFTDMLGEEVLVALPLSDPTAKVMAGG